MFVSKLMGLASGVATMAAAWGLVRAIRQRDDAFNLVPVVLLATNASFAHWALMGLETLLQTALVTAAYWRFEKERRGHRLWPLSALLCVLAAMARFDSLLYLAPLGLYGFWLVLQRRLPLKRLLLWTAVAALPFATYTTWRVYYFGDLLPNTYYAKQRLVMFEGHDRSLEQLWRFYFDQTGSTRSVPQGTVERLLGRVAMASTPSLLWMNLWMVSAGLCLLAACTFIILPRRWQRAPLLVREVYSAKVCCLVFAPWLLNIYYIYHVNGDWMPNYRFFQVGLVFIGVAGGVGFGWIIAIAGRLLTMAASQMVVWIATCVTAGWLLLGTAYEQLHVGSVYIFGKGSFTHVEREEAWLGWSAMRRNYSRGFVLPLDAVAHQLLLNTQSGGRIFMSDVGQPLWYAEHLSLYDVDGLTDPRLGHAPNHRGDVPAKEEIIEQRLRERGLSRASADLKADAARTEFELLTARNAQWIMEEVRPEYLLIFINHQDRNPASPGYAYPQIAAEVYQHPNLREYREVWHAAKVGNVFNHLYARHGVAELAVPDGEKLRRLFQAIRRNPRVPALVSLLYDESRKMNLTPEQKQRVESILQEALLRWRDETFLVQLTVAARHAGDTELTRRALQAIVQGGQASASVYRALAKVYEEGGELESAERMLQLALKADPQLGVPLLHELMWYNEQLGRIEQARLHAEEAIRRQPGEHANRMELAGMLDRAAMNPRYSREKRAQYAQEAVVAYQDVMSRTTERSHIISQRITELGVLFNPAAEEQK